MVIISSGSLHAANRNLSKGWFGADTQFRDWKINLKVTSAEHTSPLHPQRSAGTYSGFTAFRLFEAIFSPISRPDMPAHHALIFFYSEYSMKQLETLKTTESADSFLIKCNCWKQTILPQAASQSQLIFKAAIFYQHRDWNPTCISMPS